MDLEEEFLYLVQLGLKKAVTKLKDCILPPHFIAQFHNN